jgi:hypothetical protein
MPARVVGSRNALVLRNAPATEPKFKVLRTALVLAVAFNLAPPGVVLPNVDVALRVAFRVLLRVDVAFRVELISDLLPMERPRVLWTAKDRVRENERPVLGWANLPTERLGALWTAKDRLPRALGRAYE